MSPHKLDYHTLLFMSFFGVFIWVNFMTTNNKQMLKILIGYAVRSENAKNYM